MLPLELWLMGFHDLYILKLLLQASRFASYLARKQDE
jgi:hypothetical protein